MRTPTRPTSLLTFAAAAGLLTLSLGPVVACGERAEEPTGTLTFAIEEDSSRWLRGGS